jgi:hypothetical protein
VAKAREMAVAAAEGNKLCALDSSNLKSGRKIKSV